MAGKDQVTKMVGLHKEGILEKGTPSGICQLCPVAVGIEGFWENLEAIYML